jgi:gamma-glutamyltranspeptidase/glutathione hydrolase
MVSSGHPQATLAAIQVLKRGGNAVDAGVAMGLCLNVVQPDFTNFGGVAPIMIYLASEDTVVTISGLGTWPSAVSLNLMQRRGGVITDESFLSSIVPSTPDAWITALDRYGTMRFTDVIQHALNLAQHGFPAYPLFINNLQNGSKYHRWESTRRVFYPSGTTPHLGDLIIQRDLARTFKRLIRVEQQHRHYGRHEALQAVRDAFYQGSIAKELVTYIQEQGGILTTEDLAKFHVDIEAPVKTTYRDIEVYCCGPWCQGPVNAMTLNILEGYELEAMKHNSAPYIHILASALDLAFADRERFIGDPRFIDVPINRLLSKSYASTRRKLIQRNHAWGQMPPSGNLCGNKITFFDTDSLPQTSKDIPQDTSYGCVIDSEGNGFSATPSDGGRLVPDLGIVVSPRGTQSWLDPHHPSSVEPGKRPRLTPNPALALKDGRLFLIFGTPGGDSQPQTMVQLLVNIIDFHMTVQEAIAAPRFRSENFPNSFWPHTYLPGRLNIESRISSQTRRKLQTMGHEVHLYPELTWNCGGACAILVDSDRDVLMGGADPRRECYALGY